MVGVTFVCWAPGPREGPGVQSLRALVLAVAVAVTA